MGRRQMAHILNRHQQHDTLQLPAHLRGHRMPSLRVSQWLSPCGSLCWQELYGSSASMGNDANGSLGEGGICGCKTPPNHSLSLSLLDQSYLLAGLPNSVTFQNTGFQQYLLCNCVRFAQSKLQRYHLLGSFRH